MHESYATMIYATSYFPGIKIQGCILCENILPQIGNKEAGQ